MFFTSLAHLFLKRSNHKHISVMKSLGFNFKFCSIIVACRKTKARTYIKFKFKGMFKCFDQNKDIFSLHGSMRALISSHYSANNIYNS